MVPINVDSTRRRFLKQSAGTLIGTSALLTGSLDQENAHAPRSTRIAEALPPHRAFEIPGLHAYAERSVAAGRTIHFRTSSTVPYRLSICRLAGDVDDPASDIVLHTFDESRPTPQPIHPGSYVHVANGLEPSAELDAISLECWVRPWKLDDWQGLITQHDYPDACGFGLFIDPDGRAALYLGDGGRYLDARMFAGGNFNHRRWNHVVGTWDGEQATLWVNGRKSGQWGLSDHVRSGDADLRLAAYARDGLTDRFLEGDLAMPVLYDRALSAHQILERIDTRGLAPPAMDHVIACWPLDEEGGSSVADIGSGRRDGRIINHASWMIGGPSFHSDAVGRYDESYDPEADETRGHGLRFAGDDLYDCRWDVSHEFMIPEDAKSGVYVGRFEYDFDGARFHYPVTFNVQRAPSRPKAPVLVLLSSSTWTAYNSAPFPVPAGGLRMVGTNGQPNAHPQAPAFSCYRDHQHGQPAYYFGVKMPWPAAGPEWTYLDPKFEYSHLMRGELFLHRWLDGEYGDHDGYDYDIVTDQDLHVDPEILDGYQTLFINGHSEYWSAEAYDGVDRFLSRGGTVAVLSGNTMFWRTSFSDDGTVMESRKYDPRIGGRGGATVGELYHSHDKRRGSLLRECGRPAWRCIGLECVGWSNAVDSAYQTDTPDHFLFSEPEDTEIAASESFGKAGDDEYPMSIGHEWDVRLATLRKMTREIPDGAELPEEPEGITTLAYGILKGAGLTLDYFTHNAPLVDGVCAEMIYWERPNGGRVFHAGSIAAGSVLSVDPKWRTVMRNVLHHFGVSPRRS